MTSTDDWLIFPLFFFSLILFVVFSFSSAFSFSFFSFYLLPNGCKLFSKWKKANGRRRKILIFLYFFYFVHKWHEKIVSNTLMNVNYFSQFYFYLFFFSVSINSYDWIERQRERRKDESATHLNVIWFSLFCKNKKRWLRWRSYWSHHFTSSALRIKRRKKKISHEI